MDRATHQHQHNTQWRCDKPNRRLLPRHRFTIIIHNIESPRTHTNGLAAMPTIGEIEVEHEHEGELIVKRLRRDSLPAIKGQPAGGGEHQEGKRRERIIEYGA